MSDPFTHSSLTKQDANFELPLRPQTLSDFVGQDSLRERLELFIGAALQRKEALGHCLFYGPPGLGKTTLAHILSKSMGTNLVITSGPVIEKAGDLAAFGPTKRRRYFIYRQDPSLKPRSRRISYPAMEDFVLDLMIDSGPSARSVQVKLNRFTLVGSTTRAGLLSAPMRSRFGFTCRLDYYEPKVLEKIIMRSSKILNLALEKEGQRMPQRARGTPRIANNLLRWVRDYAQMRTKNRADRETRSPP